MAHPFLILGGVAVGIITAGIGVLQVPGWIAGAQDASAVTDLSNLALGQATAISVARQFVSLDALRTGDVDGVQALGSEGVATAVALNYAKDRWAAVAVSETGHVFVRTSDSTSTLRSEAPLKEGASTPLAGKAIPKNLPVGVTLGGTRSDPKISVSLPTAISSWRHLGSGDASLWATINAPGEFVHAPIAQHATILSNTDEVDQERGFIVSAEVTLASGTTSLAGVAFGNGANSFEVLLDSRNGTGTTAPVQLRRNTSILDALVTSPAASVSGDVPYKVEAHVKGQELRVVVKNTQTGEYVADVTRTIARADFVNLTQVGVFAYNTATIRNLSVR